MEKKRFVSCLISTLVISGCAIRKNLETPFSNPVNKPPLDTGSDPTKGTKYCSRKSDGTFDNVTVSTEVTILGDGSAQAEGGGCVLRPIREVWAVLNNMPVMKFDAADSFTYTRTVKPKADFTHLYTVTYAKGTPLGDINWTIEWYHGFDQGTFLAPERVNIEYQRTGGTAFIPTWQGGIVLDKVSDSVTSIALLNDFRALQSNSDNEDSARAALVEIVKHAREGAPDWTALNSGLKDNPSQPDPKTTCSL